ncbi:sulfoxide reductase heme-binding subunit YedZ [Maribrevibacterium harenarium]|uniref:Sulfoxide reductase heme-binding subunit YedZ n=1 Tax=Maribrevibacterium harenarium TaxID=2589817 RepID=A0A501WG14_9GAMM|nr:ferric reductase-like transmembrane domain-containing protein [Maribrevibacterium harenarium]TPE47415.1 sulfoxide reductase heme-binding subunit YedZ [Maribrevibacterium harenarium]
MTWTGVWTIVMLFLTLVVSPLSKRIRRVNLLKCRQGLGLASFCYAFLHLLAYLFLHAGLDATWVVEDLTEKPYIIFGWLAFGGYVLLASTSNRVAKRKLKQRWKSLHRAVYLIALLSLLHLWWQIRADYLISISALVALAPLMLWWVWGHPIVKKLK